MNKFPLLPLYQCHKKVRAAKILEIIGPHHNGGEVAQYGLKVDCSCGPLIVDQYWIDRFKPVVGGYFVAYEDGYVSFSPAEAFEGGYTKLCEGEDCPPSDHLPGIEGGGIHE